MTFEFENVPHGCVKLLESRVPVRPNLERAAGEPGPRGRKAFPRIHRRAGDPVPGAGGPGGVGEALAAFGRPAVLKTTRLGYDGKGQVLIDLGMEVGDAWQEMGAAVGILEGFVDFACEISVIVARGMDGGRPPTFRSRTSIRGTSSIPPPRRPISLRRSRARQLRSRRRSPTPSTWSGSLPSRCS